TGGSMHGIAVSTDGGRVYATTAQNLLWEAKVGPDRRLTLERAIALPGPESEDSASHGTGIALSELRPLALVCLSRNNSLALVNLNDGRKEEEILVGVAPYDVVIDPHGLTVYVSNWGGRFPTAGDRTAESSGTPTVIDERGVAATGSISIVDLAARKEVRQIAVGLHPSDLALTKDGKFLYVACANSDEVCVIDTAVHEVIESFSVRPNAALPFGSLPNAIALGPREDRLYVANGGNNAVAVVDVAPERRRASVVRGFIPAGWFPAALTADADRLYVANAKGIGSRSKHAGQRGWDVYWHRGSVSQVAYPAEAELASYTESVLTNARLPQALRAWERSNETRKAVAVPAALGEPSVFEHVIYVVKENRTYDQVFGDLPQGNGDPELCIFPRELTPNHHALAEQFVLLDNYYCNGINSADGHAWSMEGIVTDHLEKSFGGFTRSYTFGNDPISYASSGFIWDSVLSAGLSFRNFGEFNATSLPSASISFLDVYRDYTAETRSITFTHSIGVDRLRTFSSPDYPGWNLNIPDQLRADLFIRELHAAEADGAWPSMTIVYLPQDHTSGTKGGMPTPRAHVADNDLALGRIVEAVSKSRFWPKTCIFVIEDDPQNGYDHVDGHRSLCGGASPYTKRGAVVRWAASCQA
ncbi:MAG: bifunctional YncE family protein/alkaline phosphatase family protein, partial [Candidatus Hydrogenedentota bacterium]